jgi:hypothetical protein
MEDDWRSSRGITDRPDEVVLFRGVEEDADGMTGRGHGHGHGHGRPSSLPSLV